ACDAGNNLGSVSTFLSTHGLADPGCWPYHTDNAPYAPTPDRDGRSVPGTGPGGGALPEG
ncbi:MAG: hypothetical protein ACXV0U_08695, partial [Kineosporiaceae bacterium]